MNVGIGTAAAQFLFWECLFQIFCIVSLQCSVFQAIFAHLLSAGRLDSGTIEFLILSSNFYPSSKFETAEYKFFGRRFVCAQITAQVPLYKTSLRKNAGIIHFMFRGRLESP
jgi:hypothetical protein